MGVREGCTDRMGSVTDSVWECQGVICINDLMIALAFILGNISESL